MGLRQVSGIVCAGIAAAALCGPGSTAAAPGDLATGFGDGGILRVDAAPDNLEEIVSLAVGPDHRIVGLGSTITHRRESPILTRIDARGRLDKTFDGDGGILLDQLREVEPYAGFSIAPDGGITFLTWLRTFATLNPDGSLAGQGDIGGSDDFPNAMLGLADGRFLLAGEFFDGPDALIRRYLPDATPDPSFGNGGVADLSGLDADEFDAIIERPDGGYIALGEAYIDGQDGSVVSLVALNPDGSLDIGFGDGGEALIDPHRYLSFTHSLAIEPDGDILASFMAGGQSLLRVQPDGTLDTSFGKAGILRIQQPREASERVISILPQAGGQILVAVSRGYGSGLRMLEPDGSLDTGFGGGDGVTYSNRWFGSAAIQIGSRVIFSGADLEARKSQFRAFSLADDGEPNADGDSVADADDRCPETPAANVDGCPRTPRAVHLDHRPGRFLIRVYSPGDYSFDCDELGRVRLDLLRPGKSPKLIGTAPVGSGSYDTIRIGSWRFHGRFVATAVPVEEARGMGVCKRARSKVLEIPVHRDPDEDH